MSLKAIYFCILILFILNGCSNNKLSYIENDNYNKSYHYYLHDIKINNKRYYIKSIFDDKKSYITAKKLISDMKKSYINKYNIYIIILCPQQKFKTYNINIFLNYIGDFYNFLTNEKNFTNQIYTLGIPNLDVDRYKAIIYFVPF